MVSGGNQIDKPRLHFSTKANRMSNEENKGIMPPASPTGGGVNNRHPPAPPEPKNPYSPGAADEMYRKQSQQQ
jgi:hypothetical protein